VIGAAFLGRSVGVVNVERDFATVLCAFVSAAAGFYEAATETNTPRTHLAKKNEVEQSVQRRAFWCAAFGLDGDLCGAPVRGPWRQLNGP